MTMRNGWWIPLAALIVSLTYSMANSDAQPDKEKKSTKAEKQDKKTDAKSDPSAAPKKPATVKIERKLLQIEVTGKGILEAADSSEILFRPQPLSLIGSLTIARIVDHGTVVRKGDELVAFDTLRIDQSIHDGELELKQLETSLKLSEEDLALLEKTTPLDLEAAERDKKQADEDLKYFLEVAKPEMLKNMEFGRKSGLHFVESAREELRQLEKMYKANDLTEETEQIVLKRQRHQVEMAENSFKRSEVEREKSLRFDIPRRETAAKNMAIRTTLTLERTQRSLEPGLLQKRNLHAKLKNDREKAAERLAKLKKDRAAMTMTAPIDGVVYHGKFSKGQWTGAGSGKLVQHGSVLAEDVFMTILSGKPTQVRFAVDEKDAILMKPNLEGKARFLFDPELRLKAHIAKISAVPIAPGQFEAIARIDVGMQGADLKPGMACGLKFIAYSRKDALTAPASAIFEEDDKHFVYLVDKAGKHQKREVGVGKTANARVEILRGVEAGDEILADKPEDSKEGAKS